MCPRMLRPIALGSFWCFAVLAAPPVPAVVDGISAERLEADMRKLESFGTRDSNGLIAGPGRGVVAAREWLAEEFRRIGPPLQVRLDAFPVKKQGRVVRDLEMVNVVAVLPGETDPETHVVIGAHYDTLSFVYRPGTRTPDNDATAATEKAPGVSDNASGVACVLELARQMARYRWPKTIVFIAFAGEEQGLFGAKAYAGKAEQDKVRIEAMLNVDTIGTDTNGAGGQAGNRINVFSGEPADSRSRTLARYIREMGERYVPELQMNTVFREDRFGRGGDHTPFDRAGFAAVRFTTPAEQLEKQHTEHDTFETISVRYVALVTRGIGAVLASLAAAPSAPQPLPLERGASRYDAVLKWKPPASGPAPDSYVVYQRATTSPFWEKSYPAGKETSLTLKHVSIDEWTFGVRAVGANGAESLIEPWTLIPTRFAGPPR